MKHPIKPHFYSFSATILRLPGANVDNFFMPLNRLKMLFSALCSVTATRYVYIAGWHYKRARPALEINFLQKIDFWRRKSGRAVCNAGGPASFLL